jgi:hypothetical protein
MTLGMPNALHIDNGFSLRGFSAPEMTAVSNFSATQPAVALALMFLRVVRANPWLKTQPSQFGNRSANFSRMFPQITFALCQPIELGLKLGTKLSSFAVPSSGSLFELSVS